MGIYRFRYDRAKAKAAYAKLDPSLELHAQLCIAAAAWAIHYEKNGVDRRWRVRLHNWISSEKYLEDTPQVYADAKSAAIAKTRGSSKRGAANKVKAEPPPAEAPPALEPDPWPGDVDRSAPIGTFPATIKDSVVDWNEYGRFLTLMLSLSDCSSGTEISHSFDIDSERGLGFISSLCRAVGFEFIEDTEVLHGNAIECTITDRGKISYAELSAPVQEAA